MISSTFIRGFADLYRQQIPHSVRAFNWRLIQTSLMLLRITAGRMVSAVLWLLYPVVPIRLGWTTENNRIGHMIEPMDNYLRLFAEHRAKGGIDRILWRPENGVANEPMWRIMERHVPICRSRAINRLMNFIEPGLIRNRNFMQLNDNAKYFVAQRKPAVLRLTDDEIAAGQRWLQDQGIDADDWYVCMLNRDSSYLKTVYTDRDFSYHDHRDYSVHTLIKAGEEIARRGGYVFRVGATVNEPWPAPHHDRIIDYAVGARDPFLDVFLAATCRFYLGGATGAVYLPGCFGARIAISNLVPLTYMGFDPKGFCTPKLVRDLNSGELLHFREAKKLGLFELRNHRPLHRGETYAQRGVEFVQNDADDILGLCRDMLDYERVADVPEDAREIQVYYEKAYIGEASPLRNGPLAPSFALRYRHLIL